MDLKMPHGRSRFQAETEAVETDELSGPRLDK